MIGFVLTGHGQFAPGLKSAVDMVAGEQPNFEVVPFAGSEAVTFGDDLRTCIAKMRQACDGVLVFVDLLGGTLDELAERARVVGREGVDLKKLESADIDEDDEM